MKKSILIMVLFCSILSISAQNKSSLSNKYYSLKKKSLAEMAALEDKSLANHNVFCLIMYHNQRMKAFRIGLGAAVLGGGAVYANSRIPFYHPDFITGARNFLAIGAGVAGISSLILYIDAEKWISKNNLIFTGDGLAYRF